MKKAAFMCEWNPLSNSHAWNHDTNLHPAVYEVGHEVNYWRLCASCANHDKFKDRRKRLLRSNEERNKHKKMD